MSEDSNKLSYTIKFEPDIPSLKESIDKASAAIKDRVSKIISKALSEMTPDLKKPLEQMVPTELVENMRTLRNEMIQALRVWDLTAFGAIRTQRPQEKTLGNLAEQTVRELELAARSGEAMGPLVATVGATALGSIIDRITANPQDIIGVMQTQIGAVTESVSESGIAMRSAIQSFAELLQNRALFKREFVEFESLKMGEKAAVKAAGHPFLAEVGTAFMEKREPPGAKFYPEATFDDILKMFKVPEAERKQIPERMMRPDLWIFSPDMIRAIDFKPILESAEVAIMDTYDRLLQEKIMPRVKDLSVLRRRELGLAGTGEIVGKTEAIYGAATGRNVEALEGLGIMATDLGDLLMIQLQERIRDRYPQWMEKVREIVSGDIDSTARAYIDNLVQSLRVLIEVLKPSSLPSALVDMGLEQWIEVTAREYVNALRDSVAGELAGTISELEPEDKAKGEGLIRRRLDSIERGIRTILELATETGFEEPVLGIEDLDTISRKSMRGGPFPGGLID